MKRGLSGRARAIARPLITVAVLLLGWELWVQLADVEVYVVPSMTSTLEGMVTESEELLPAARLTVTETLLGFAIAAVASVALAAAFVAWRPLEKSVYPLVVTSQLIPLAAIAPLMITWFGFGLMSKLIIVFLICFFPIVVNGVAGLRSVETEKLYLARSMGASEWKVFAKIRFPAALPNLFAGLKLAAAFAVVGAVLGEFVGAEDGLGHIVLESSGTFDTVLVFAALMYLIIFATAFFYAVAAVERVTIHWHVSQRTGGEQSTRSLLTTAEAAR
ncbi:MAG: NitT/TauT family transport system permease protein [Thermoleophilaceae bacterium]|jgi:NitT/TauT family transport system permease protein|nr:NitT/TauT family transport system permease protein [Thermoleophilaceae bacterium]